LERVREALESLSLKADSAEIIAFEKTFGTEKAMAEKQKAVLGAVSNPNP